MTDRRDGQNQRLGFWCSPRKDAGAELTVSTCPASAFVFFEIQGRCNGSRGWEVGVGIGSRETIFANKFKLFSCWVARGKL
jgi:hypothetical protein